MNTQRGRQNTTRFNPFLALLLIVLAAVGTLITLEATGKTNFGLAGLFGRETRAATNGIPVLFSTRILQPGDQVGMAAVWDPKVKGLRTQYLSEKTVAEKHYAQKYGRIRGRVLARTKEANTPFEPDDFLPKGTPPGLVGLVPEGMELMMLDPDDVLGIDALGFRNRFNLQASRALGDEIEKAAKDALEARPHVTSKDRIKLASIPKSPERLLLAQNGMVIRRASNQGKKAMVAVALYPADVGPILDALAEKVTIYCVAQSGRAADVAPRIVPETVDPMLPYRWLLDEHKEIEMYVGNEKSVGIVPVASDTGH